MAGPRTPREFADAGLVVRVFDRVVEASSNLSSALLTDQAVAIANNGDSGNIGIWASWGPY